MSSSSGDRSRAEKAVSRLKSSEPPTPRLTAVDLYSGGSIAPLASCDTSGRAGQKPEEIVAGQHAYGNSVLDHGDVMQIPLHHAAYDGR